MKGSFRVPSSKSLVNRYLVLKEGHPELNLNWSAKALDVLHLSEALKSYKNTKELYIGEGGTTLRFLVAFLSTQKGEWIIKGKPSLFKRPQKELYDAVLAMGAEISNESDSSVTVEGNGWVSGEVEVSALTTTQVLTGLVLAALSAKRALTIHITEQGLNSDYIELTKSFVSSLGFFIEMTDQKIVIPGGQSPNVQGGLNSVESDWSSAAFLYVQAALFGEIELTGLSVSSNQPDSVILDVLKKSGAVVSDFRLEKSSHYRPFDINLQKSPDLFPVLSVFACFCEGDSYLRGAPQLTLKESNRIDKISDLLRHCGYYTEQIHGGILVKGEGFKVLEHKPFIFDVSTDHRVFMACDILKKYGYQIEITGAESIEKSFPEYLDWSFE